MSELPEPKKLDFNNTLALSTLKKVSKDIEREPDNVLKQRLGNKAKSYLDRSRALKYQCFELLFENEDGTVTKQVDSMLKVPAYTEKLFEGSYIENVTESVTAYIFGKMIGYNNYFHCPTIILEDRKRKVVDISKYRPIQDGYENLPKYLYEKSENKPAERGDDFLYPFQLEMERLIKKEGYVFIGEGLKNAVNALIRSVPYVSIEGVSNASSKEIADYVNELFNNGIRVYGALDGDSAGEKAFNEINKLLDKPIKNLIDFDSGIDFTDYLRKEQL